MPSWISTFGPKAPANNFGSDSGRQERIRPLKDAADAGPLRGPQNIAIVADGFTLMLSGLHFYRGAIQAVNSILARRQDIGGAETLGFLRIYTESPGTAVATAASRRTPSSSGVSSICRDADW
jgi:hypothetical protein